MLEERLTTEHETALRLWLHEGTIFTRDLVSRYTVTCLLTEIDYLRAELRAARARAVLREHDAATAEGREEE